MKLFFCAMAVLLGVSFLSGCGTSAGNEGHGDSTQLAEVETTYETKAALPEIYGSKAGVPELYRPKEGVPELHGPKAAAPEFPNLQPDGAENVSIGSTLPDAAKDQSSKPRISDPGASAVRAVAKNVRLGKQNIGGMTENELRATLLKVAPKTDVAAIDAKIDAKTWKVVNAKAGKRLDVGKTVKAALAAKAGAKIQYSWSPVYPKVTVVQLKKNVRMIAKFSTPFLDRSAPRIRNIKRVSAKLDKMIIMPGQKFSFNVSTGSKSKRAGYENATIIVRTPKGPKHKKAPGGGVCQVSTTLYNAVLRCGMRVTERHEHSDDVYYVPDGKDATVMYGGADFKFVNNRRYPVMIRVYVGKKAIQVRIYENSANAGQSAIIS